MKTFLQESLFYMENQKKVLYLWIGKPIITVCESGTKN